ncbi:MAG TPA: hypothetical protein VGL46_05065 [Pseudonocardiaceae bacterium]|jgi:hypothetical protein
MATDDETDHREVGSQFAEQAGVAASRFPETEGAAMTCALLAIYHELRHNDLSTKIEELTEQVGEIVSWQRERDRTSSRIASSVDDVKDAISARWR